MEIWDFGLIISKFALYVGVFFSAGSVFFRVIFESPELKSHVRIKGLVVSFSLLGMVATLTNFQLRGASLSGEIAGLFNAEMLAIVWATPVKYAFVLRLLGFGIMLFSLISKTYKLPIQIIGALIVIGSFSLTGHVSQTDHILFSFLLFLHILLLSLWIGILIPLFRLSKIESLLKPTADIAHRFGQLAAFFVPLLIIAGVIISYRLVGSLEKLVGTGYGINLLIKVGLVGLILALAALHKFKLVPAMLSGDQKAREHLHKSVAVETLLVLAVILVTAFLTTVQQLPGSQ